MFSKTGVTSSIWASAKSVVINLFVKGEPEEGAAESREEASPGNRRIPTSRGHFARALRLLLRGFR